MTEKRFTMVNTNLVDDDGLVYYLIKKDGKDIVQVFGKHTAKKIINELNALHEENIMLKQKIDRQLHRNKRYSRQNEEVMGFLHDNYYSIWEEVLKECYHD